MATKQKNYNKVSCIKDDMYTTAQLTVTHDEINAARLRLSK